MLERADVRISSFAREICATLPSLWRTADDLGELLLKADLFGIVTKVVEALGSESTSIWPTVIPLILLGLQPQPRDEFDVDALELWITALRHCSTLTTAPNTSDLFPRVISLMQESPRLFDLISAVIEGYFFLDASMVVQFYAIDLLRAFDFVYNNPEQTNVKEFLTTVHIMVHLSPATMWIEAFHVSGLFLNLFSALGDQKADNVAQHLYLFARMLLQDASLFTVLMHEAANLRNIPVDDYYNTLIDQLEWWTRTDTTVYEPQYRKLLAMGAACLVSTGLSPVLERMPSVIFHIRVDVLTELEEGWESPSSASSDEYDSLFSTDWVVFPIPPDALGTPEIGRRTQVNAVDPVRIQDLGAFLKQNIAQAAVTWEGGLSVFDEKYVTAADEGLRCELGAGFFIARELFSLYPSIHSGISYNTG